jgi:hypothetical protein
MLVLMTFSHSPTILSNFTLNYFGYISELEGFVFLSGFVAGLTYMHISFQREGSVLWRRAMVRARTIYLYHIFTFLILFVLLRILANGQDYWGSWLPLFKQNIFRTLFMCGTLLYQPKFLDILPMYVIFILATPLVIQQFKKNKGLHVLVASMTVWALAQVGLRMKLTLCFPTSLHIYFGNYDIFAWQLLFVCGLYLGFLHQTLRWKQSGFQKSIFTFCSAVIVIGFFMCRHHLFMGETIVMATEELANKGALGFARLLNFAAIIFLVTCGYRFLRLNFATKLLAYLGRHSLQVFCFHLPIVVCMNIFLPRSPFLNETVKVLIVILAVVSLYLPAWICERQNKRSRLAS